MTHELVISVSKLTKRYERDRLAVDSLSMCIRKGEIYGFIGPNGAGKTTVMRILVGLIRPTSGGATILGHAVGSPAANARIGAMIEEPAFYAHLSGRDNLRVMALHAGVSMDIVDEVLAQVDLTDRADDKFATYSMGMRQRTGLAAALLKRPDILIMDEPTNGLDPEGIAEMRTLLRNLSHGERTIMLSSHLMAEVEQICDRIGIIQNGRMVLEGTVEELRGSPKLSVTADPLDRAFDLVSRLPYVEAVQRNGNGFVVSTPIDRASEINKHLVSNDIAVSRLAPSRNSVEDTLLQLLSSERTELHE